jgi:tetratricopeptide (TPR) repeat protein
MFLRNPIAALALGFWLLPFHAGAQSISGAQQAEARGDWPQAEREWRGLLRTMPTDFRLWTSLGIALAHENRYEEAIAAYRKSLSLRPADPLTELNLGLAFFKTGKLQQAIPPLRLAAAALPSNQQVQTLLGMSLFGTGQYRAAAAHLETAVPAERAKPDFEQVLAQCYLYGGEYPKAIATFERMLVRDPDSPAVHMFLGEAYDADGKMSKAIEEFRTAVGKGSVPNLHFGLGYLLWRSHEYPEAAAEFQKELTTDPRHYQALAYLGDTLLRQGRQAEATKLLEQSIAVQDNVWLTHFHLGVMALERKQYSRAIDQLKRAIALSPQRAEPHYRLAQAYRAAGDLTAARAELERVKTLHQRNQDDIVVKVSGSKPTAQ